VSELTIITTSDGSHSLVNTALNETYHSTHGAIQESLHVFIKNGFDFLLQQNTEPEIHILEMGFGTGLNVLLTLQGRSHKKVFYTSLEAYPINVSIASQLNYPAALPGDDRNEFIRLHTLPWDRESEMNSNFYFTKLNTKLEEAHLEQGKYDLVYYDAFAPSKQPAMWELSVLRKVAEAMKPNGVFVTYCAKGQLKRDLKSLGFFVETLSGPPGKKEMVRAVKTVSQ
jgi:tRNA U34 5-methylaminomethyl-2-thiouridine-forming methyltransferase MnmC